jgi:catechol 2,3-dioxygenase-like lactoylglutathione lyase family enzyme
MIAKDLAYVALVVTDVEATATALARDFGLRRTDCSVDKTGRSAPVFRVGASALALFAPNDPFVGGQAKPGLHHIALEVPDLASAADAAMACGIDSAQLEPGPGLGRSRRLGLPPEATAGVTIHLSEPLLLEPAHSSWVERIDHIGVASADNTAAIALFSKQLGFPLESTQTDLEVQIAVESFTSDKYGVVYHTRAPEPVGGLRVAFITVGDCELEFLQDFDPRQGARVGRDAPGTTKQDQGAIARFIAARGPGLHHIALKVTDIDGALAALASAGHSLIDPVSRPGSRRSQIAFIHPKSLNGVLMHLVERQQI